MKYYFLTLAVLLSWTSCQTTPPTKDTNRAVKATKKIDGDYSEIIRIEDSILDDFADTSKMAKMSFSETEYDFGTVDEGDIVKHTFLYKNTGKKALMLKVAHSTCGCTVPHYNTNTPLAPGDTDSIVVIFDTKHKTNRQEKPITVIANSYPNKVKLYLRGFVNEKN